MPDGTTASSNEDQANVSAESKAKGPGGIATSGRARIGIAIAALAFYAIFLLRTSFSIGGKRYFVLFEDAMISMRYSEHLAHGQGLTWNIGEPPIDLARHGLPRQTGSDSLCDLQHGNGMTECTAAAIRQRDRHRGGSGAWKSVQSASTTEGVRRMKPSAYSMLRAAVMPRLRLACTPHRWGTRV